MKNAFKILLGLAWFSFVFYMIEYLMGATAMYIAIGIWLIMAIISVAYSTWFFGSFSQAMRFSLGLSETFDNEPKPVKLNKEFHEEETE